MQGISELLKPIKKKKTKKGYRWQEQALECIKKLTDGKDYKGSIFRCYKIDERRADIALLDCLELDKPYSKYFLKVFHSLN